MGKRGSDASTAGLEEAARESNALQRQIYEESVQRGQPYYDVGVGGLNQLANLMGISTAGTAGNRDRLLDQYRGQFTSQGQGAQPITSPTVIGDSIRAIPNEGGLRLTNLTGGGGQSIRGGSLDLDASGNFLGDPSSLNQNQLNMLSTYRALYGGGTPSQVDESGLQAFVDQKIAEQQQAERGDNFGSLMQTFGMDQFEADPSYAFRQAEGNKAIERALAAQGKSYTPEAVKALQDYNQNLASQEYGNAFNRYNINQSNVYNRLANLAGVGQTAINQLDQAGSQMASNIGQTNASLAQSQLAAQQANAANRSSMFGNILGLGGQVAGLFF